MPEEAAPGLAPNLSRSRRGHRLADRRGRCSRRVSDTSCRCQPQGDPASSAAVAPAAQKAASSAGDACGAHSRV